MRQRHRARKPPSATCSRTNALHVALMLLMTQSPPRGCSRTRIHSDTRITANYSIIANLEFRRILSPSANFYQPRTLLHEKLSPLADENQFIELRLKPDRVIT